MDCIISGLYTDFYELTMAQAYYNSELRNATATFDLYFRSNPFEGGYAIFAGLEEAIQALTLFRFSTEDLAYLEKQGFQPEFLDYLKNFKFNGDIHGFREGDVVFGGDILLRVTANVMEGQLVETLLLNIINFQTLIATKAMRTVHAARGRSVVDFGMRRAQGLAAMAASRAAYIGGVDGTSNTAAAARYGIPATGTHAHSWVQGFDSELDAFRAFAGIYPDRTTLLVDTYDTLGIGIPNAIQVARELRKKGGRLGAVRLDSGDLAYFSRKARAALDEAGLEDVKIVASNQLDERLIVSLLEQGAPIDIFGVGTRLVTGQGQPALDGVFKLSQLNDRPTLKFSENPEKINLPGRKQVVRYVNGENRFALDGILLDDEDVSRIRVVRHPSVEFKRTRIDREHFSPETVFHPIMKAGQAVMTFPELATVRSFARERFNRLPDGHKRFVHPHVYRIGLSNALYNLRRELIKKRRTTL